MVKLIADSINGVMEVDEFFNLGHKVTLMDQDDFYDSLRLLKNGIIGTTVIDEDFYHLIDEEYGINKLM